jgi:hypothetical protein
MDCIGKTTNLSLLQRKSGSEKDVSKSVSFLAI